MDCCEESRIERIPLFFTPSVPNLNINYMRQNFDAWDISKFEQPLKLYQPEVYPTPEGGFVINQEPQRIYEEENQDNKDKKEKKNRKNRKNRKNKGEKKDKSKFDIVYNEYIKAADDQSWYMYTDDKKVFKGTPFEFKGAVISHNKQGFYLSFCDNAIKFAPELNIDAKNGYDLDKIQNEMKLKKERAEAMAKKSYFTSYIVAKELEERECNQEQSLKGSDSDADFENEFDDDDEMAGNDLFDEIPSDGVDFTKEHYDDEEVEEEEEEEKEEEESNEAQKDTDEIINEAIGEPVIIKEDDIVRFFKDMGMVQSRDLISRFKSMLKTDEQKAAFKEILKRRVAFQIINGVKYLKLK